MIPSQPNSDTSWRGDDAVVTRVDPPHVATAARPVPPEPPFFLAVAVANAMDASAMDSSEVDASGMDSGAFNSSGMDPSELNSSTMDTSLVAEQAAQLADHLRQRQRDLDRREAQLHARLARHENELRTSRLMIRERQAALAEREQEFACESRRSAAELQRQQEALREQERRLQQHQALQIPLPAMIMAAPDSQQSEHCQRQQLLETQLEQQAAIRTVLESQLADLQYDRQQFELERASFSSEIQLARQELDAERRRVRSAGTAEQEKLDRQREILICNQAVVEQRLEEALQLHRETLELRLTTEQLWEQLAGTTAPIELSKSLARLRARLEEQYRLARESLAEQLNELRVLSKRLDDQQRELLRHREELQNWASTRRDEFDALAESLAGRESALAQRVGQFENERQAWIARRQEQDQLLRRALLPAASV